MKRHFFIRYVHDIRGKVRFRVSARKLVSDAGTSAAMAHVVREQAQGGMTHMARDRMLLSGAEAGVCAARVYTWNEPWVTLGQFQRVQDALLPDSAVGWARRPTGGRAVLHGHDVTVGLAIPLSTLGGAHGVRKVYPVVIGILAGALRDSGAPALLGADLIGERGEWPRSADCFATVSPNDIVHPVTGQKVCGCAMRLTERAVLVQASIPAAPPLIDPSRVYLKPAPVSWIDVDAERLALALEVNLNKKLG